MATTDRGPRKHEISMPDRGTVKVYAGVRVGRALDEVSEDLTLYQGVRLAQVLEAVYEQGLKDGRGEVLDAVSDLGKQKSLAHRNPGRPKKG